MPAVTQGGPVSRKGFGCRCPHSEVDRIDENSPPKQHPCKTKRASQGESEYRAPSASKDGHDQGREECSNPPRTLRLSSLSRRGIETKRLICSALLTCFLGGCYHRLRSERPDLWPPLRAHLIRRVRKRALARCKGNGDCCSEVNNDSRASRSLRRHRRKLRHLAVPSGSFAWVSGSLTRR
jgi:hypothetical protein